MGEAHHVSHSERTTLIRAARRALDGAGFPAIPIIAGTGAGSTRETIELSKAAAEAGADYAIVICSGYFAGALANNRKALKTFWTEVAAKSPIPVIIYNCTSRFTSQNLRSFILSPTHAPSSSPFIHLINTDTYGSLTADPGASGGIDLDSDLITELATESPNLAGVKLTWVHPFLLVQLRETDRGVPFSTGAETLASSHGFAPRCRTHPSSRSTRV